MDKIQVYANRLAGVRKYMEDRGLNGALFTSYENRRYFSGFTGSNGYLIISFDKAVLITDKRYTTQAQQQCVGVEVVEYLSGRLDLTARYVKEMGIDRIVMEGCLTMDEYLPLKEKLGDIYVTFEQEYFLEQRMVKTPDEILMLKEAIAIAEMNAPRNGGVCETVARDALSKKYNVPIVLASELVGGLNVIERGATALLNARLLPVVEATAAGLPTTTTPLSPSFSSASAFTSRLDTARLVVLSSIRPFRTSTAPVKSVTEPVIFSVPTPSFTILPEPASGFTMVMVRAVVLSLASAVSKIVPVPLPTNWNASGV